MKKTILSVALAVIMLNANSQEKKESSNDEKPVNVPEAVKSAFAKKYSKVTKVQWSLEKEGEYEAEFEMNNADMSAVIDEKGKILVVESEIKESALPQAVKNTIAKDFTGYKIEEFEMADKEGEITFEMKAEKDNKDYELVFDNNGKLLNQEEIKEEKEND